MGRAIEQFARIRGRFTTLKTMPAVFNVIGGFALHQAAEQLGYHSGSILFLEGDKDMKKTSLLKLVAALLIAAGAFFTPSILGAKGGPLGCRPDGVTCRPSDFVPCCGVCSKGICRPILE